MRAAAYPPDLAEAASAAGADDVAWDYSVRALEPFPELLQRMAQSPYWTAQLADAAFVQEPGFMNAVQALRQRASASGHLQNSGEQLVYQSGPLIFIAPAAPGVVYLPYYDPWLVYGAWQPAYRFAYWRPWRTERHFVTDSFYADEHHRPGWRDERNGPRSPASQIQVQSPQNGSRENGGLSPAAQIQATAPQINRQGNGGPSPARQMQLQSQQIRAPSPVLQERQQQVTTPIPSLRPAPVLQSAKQPRWHENASAGASRPVVSTAQIRSPAQSVVPPRSQTAAPPPPAVRVEPPRHAEASRDTGHDHSKRHG